MFADFPKISLLFYPFIYYLTLITEEHIKISKIEASFILLGAKLKSFQMLILFNGMYGRE